MPGRSYAIDAYVRSGTPPSRNVPYCPQESARHPYRRCRGHDVLWIVRHHNLRAEGLRGRQICQPVAPERQGNPHSTLLQRRSCAVLHPVSSSKMAARRKQSLQPTVGVTAQLKPKNNLAAADPGWRSCLLILLRMTHPP